MLGTLIQGRVSVCGAAINATKVALDIAVRRGLTRRQFGPPGEPRRCCMDYRTHQRRLLPALATTYALHFAQDAPASRLHEVFTAARDDDRRRRELETFAAGLKAVATWHATDTIQACREACGGAGYLRANRFAALKADTDVFTTFEGDNTVLLQLCAKNLLTDYRDQFGELDRLGMAQFFAGQALGIVAERTAVRGLLARLADGLVPGRDDGARPARPRDPARAAPLAPEAHPRGRGAAAEGRHRRRPRPVRRARRLPGPRRRRPPARGSTSSCSRRSPTPSTRCEDPALRPCSTGSAASTRCIAIEAERGWYQEHGRLTPTRSKAVVKAVNTLCGEVRDDAGLLVEAFGVPAPALRRARPLERPRA